MKIAHEASDLALFAHAPRTRCGASSASWPTTASCGGTSRGAGIFHDVLAGAVLGWKGRYDAERAVERTRTEARRRHRRLAFLALGALVALAGMTALAAFALSQRSEARDQARAARSGSSSPAPCRWWTATPSSGSSSRSRPRESSRPPGRRAPSGSRSTRRACAPSFRPGIPWSGWTSVARPRLLLVGDDGVARLYELNGPPPLVAPGRRRGGGVPRRRPVGRADRRLGTRHARRDDGRAEGQARPGRAPRRRGRPRPEPRRRICDRAGRQAAGTSDLIGGEGAARAGRASLRRHRHRFSRTAARRVERTRLDGPGLEHPHRSRSGSRSAATTDRCWPSRSTGRVYASRRAAPTRRPACGVPERAGRSRHSSGTPAMSTTSRSARAACS